MKGQNMRPVLFTPDVYAKIVDYKPIAKQMETANKFGAPSRAAVDRYMKKYIVTSDPEKFSPLKEATSGKINVSV